MSEDLKMKKFFEKKKPEKDIQKLKQETLENESSFPPDVNQGIKDFFTSDIIKNPDQLRKDQTENTTTKYKFRKGSPSKPFKFNALDNKEKDQIFLKYYDENLMLKEKEEKLNTQIKQLSSKLNHIESEFKGLQRTNNGSILKENTNDNLVFSDLQTENQRLKEKLKALSMAKKVVAAKPSGKTKNLYNTVTNHDARVNELNRLVDLLKKKLIESNNQLKQIQENKGNTHNNISTINNELHAKNIKFATLQNRYDELQSVIESQKNMTDNTKKRLDEINEQLYSEREENSRLKKEIRTMELKVSQSKDLEQKIRELEEEKRNLNLRLSDLCQSPFIQEHEERANLRTQLLKIETNYDRVSIEARSAKDLLSKTETELITTKNRLREVEVELRQKIEENANLKASLEIKDNQLGPFKDLERENDSFLKALGIVKWKGEDPAWYKLDFLEKGGKIDMKDPESLWREIERLRMEKGELAAQLEKVQTLLKIQMETDEENRKVYQIQISQLELQLKSAINKANELAKISDLRGYSNNEGENLYEQNGVKYDDRVSVFSDDQSEIDHDIRMNYLDLWLGDAEFDETALKNIFKNQNELINDLKKVLTFLTVDFYNHDTQHSSIAEGIHTNYNFQISFKVLIEEIFLQYLDHDFIKIELYVSEGMDAFLVGRGQISLKELTKKMLGEGVAPALSSSLTLYGENNEIIGVLNFRMRMRSPISEELRWMNEKKTLGMIQEELTQFEDNHLATKRKLVISIDRATGFLPKHNSFVSYSLVGQDYYTSPQPGSNPKWDYTHIHEIKYDEAFIGYLKHNDLEFMILDDAAPLAIGVSNEINDLIGYAKVPLAPLLSNNIIDVFVPLASSKLPKSSMHIRIFFHSSSLPTRPTPQPSLISKSWEQDLILRISAALRAKELNLDSSFRIFDQDRDNLIGNNDFEKMILFTLNMGVNKEEIELLYERLDKPITREKFGDIFGPYLSSPQQDSNNAAKSNISALNSILRKNSNEINDLQNTKSENIRKAIGRLFADRISQSSEITLFQEMDINKDEYISLLELKIFLKKSGLNLTDDEIHSFLISIDLNKDNKIGINEFIKFVTNGYNVISSSAKRVSSEEVEMPARRSRLLDTTPISVLVDRLMEEITSYMKNNKITFLKLYEKIDKNKDNYLTRGELTEFLRSINISSSPKEVNALLNYFDEHNENHIGIKQFIEKIKEYSHMKNNYSLFDDEYKQIPIETLNEKVLKILADYITANKITIADLFNNFDTNNNGSLSRAEMSNFFSDKLKLRMTQDEESSFFNFFDQNRDDRINVAEFMKLMKPILEKEKSKKSIHSLNLSSGSNKNLSESIKPTLEVKNEELEEKLKDYIDKKRILLINSFKIKEEIHDEGFVSQEDFINILREVQPDYPHSDFTRNEIDIIISQYCEKNLDNKINYEKFLNLNPINVSGSRLSRHSNILARGSVKDINRSQLIAKDIFNKIANVVKKENIKIIDAFKHFDMNKDGYISAAEFKNAFKRMKFNYSDEDIDQIITLIGEKGKVDYKKFVDALKL